MKMANASLCKYCAFARAQTSILFRIIISALPFLSLSSAGKKIAHINSHVSMQTVSLTTTKQCYLIRSVSITFLYESKSKEIFLYSISDLVTL